MPKALAFIVLSLVLAACGLLKEDRQVTTGSLARGIISGSPVGASDPIAKFTVLVSFNPSGFCSGTIVDSYHVLTAGHCVKGKSNFKVRFGPNGELGIISVAQAYPHEEYRPELYNANDPATHKYMYRNDIALLRLVSPIPAGFVPVRFLNHWSKFTDFNVTFAGYGANAYTPPSTYTGVGTLRAASVLPTISYHSMADEAYQLYYTSNSVCAGDSGGPDFLVYSGVYYQVGVHSLSDCQTTSVNIATPFYLNWIASKGAYPTKSYIAKKVVLAEFGTYQRAYVRALDDQLYYQDFDSNGVPISPLLLAASGRIKSFVVYERVGKAPLVAVIKTNSEVYTLQETSATYRSAVSGTKVNEIQVTEAQDGTPRVYVRLLDNEIYMKRYNSYGDPLGSGYEPLPKTNVSGGVRKFQVGKIYDGTPRIYAQFSSGSAIWRLYLNPDGGLPSGNWYQNSSEGVSDFTLGKTWKNGDLLIAAKRYFSLNDQTVNLQKMDWNGTPVGGYYQPAPGHATTGVTEIQLAFTGNQETELLVRGLGGDSFMYYSTLRWTGDPYNNSYSYFGGAGKSFSMVAKLLGLIGGDDQLYTTRLNTNGTSQGTYSFVDPLTNLPGRSDSNDDSFDINGLKHQPGGGRTLTSETATQP